MYSRGFSRLLPALHYSSHPCRDVASFYLGKGRGRFTGGILSQKFLLLLLLLCTLLSVVPVVPVVLHAAVHPSPCTAALCWAGQSLSMVSLLPWPSWFLL